MNDLYKRQNIISSICYSDEEVFNAVSKLYLNGKSFDLDPCYSIGIFYRDFPQPKYKFDKTPQLPDVKQADVRNIPLSNNSVHSINFDPPFMFGTHGQTKNNLMNKRFTMFDSFEELKSMYKGALNEFNRILDDKGIVLFKCQDYTDSKTTLTHCLVYEWAIKSGFYAKDIFILIAKARIFNSNLKQRHACKFHSYFFVFEKSGIKLKQPHNHDYKLYIEDINFKENKSKGNCLAERCTFKDENGNCSSKGLKLKCIDRKE